MRDLSKTKPRGRPDEGPMAEMTRLESALMVAKEDRVSGLNALELAYVTPNSFAQNAARLKLQGIKDELKHIDAEVTKMKPELQEVILHPPLSLQGF